ncbi:nucleoside 2-deoxyribosyltransferase [Candidatus Woesearchaeota archaeon CG10_big_fil_rev_8_21_14_0_10_32_9]|nr:MAG: nucleoside 2-deoxyribosyltransferase [Candidatus Woesearchaeota archaeon CG10_big_fil_rev_8_21_14_0_10_32_9]
MKIYFAGSIRGGRDDKGLYNELIQYLTSYGKVLTEHVGDKNLTEFGEDGPSDEWIYNRDMSWIKEADVIIAEVSTPSLGVGYELGKAENMNKHILCLYKNQLNKRLSAMISGNKNLKLVNYKTLDEAKKHIDKFFKLLEKNC